MNKQAEKWIKKYCDELETIFAPINKELCGPCFSKGNGCCNMCAENNGYFKHEIYYNWIKMKNKFNVNVTDSYATIRWHLFTEINKLKEEYGFDEQDGFLDKTNKCCRLPRWKRSITCLGYYCNKAASHWSAGTIHDLCGRIKKIRLKHCIAI